MKMKVKNTFMKMNLHNVSIHRKSNQYMFMNVFAKENKVKYPE